MRSVVSGLGAVVVAGALVACENDASCVPVALRAEPVVVKARRTGNTPVRLTAHVLAADQPKEGLRVSFYRLAEGSTSGEFMGDVESNERGVARLVHGYVPSVDRARYQRAVRIAAVYDGLTVVDGVDYCSARAEAAFTFTES